MALYGVRLVINLFDLCIYRRYLEEFIGNRKTSMEFSVLLLIVCELIGSAVNQMGISWLNTLSMNWDGIYCGYLGAKEQLHAISHYYDSLTEKPLFIIDPVMGDHGRAYQHITPEFCNHMKDFVSRGDIITPNLTEACLLTDTPYPKHDCTDSELSAISKKLHALGVKKCIITGCPKGDTFLNYISDSSGNVDTVSTKKAGPGYPGTGDIFVSIVSALTLRGFSLQECTTQAAHFIASCISYSQSLSDDTLQGVIFEPLLSDLVTLSSQERESK